MEMECTFSPSIFWVITMIGLRFDLELNDDIICSTLPDHNDGGVQDFGPGSCSAVVDVVAGN